MRNPYVFFSVMAALLITGIIIGSYWDKWFPEEPQTTPDGEPCVTVDGKTGVMTSGNCVTSGGPNPNLNPTRTTSSY